MAKSQTSGSEKVPKAMQEKFDQIVAITDQFCQEHLTDEYAQIIRRATAMLCRKRPSPLKSGKSQSWACGITHAVGLVNFLYDPTQDPHMKVKDLYQWFGVAVSTGQGKSKQVRDLLDMCQMDPDWFLPSKMDDNLMAWLVTVDGYILDIRTAPRSIQEVALAKGLIPYIPGEQGPEKSVEPQLASSGRSSKTSPAAADALFVLEVFIVDGPLTEAFVRKNPEMSRVIEIKGSHTLQNLHRIIFKAYDREEEHMYEFQVGGKGPQDPAATRYGLQSEFMGVFDAESAPQQDVATTQIADVGLQVDDAFGYWFDFGDDWWHQINVVEIKEKAPKGKYPKITKRVGASPPQYANFD